MKTEPGEKAFWIARFWSGWCGSLTQARPLRPGHAAGEPVRVVGGRGDEGQDLPGPRVHRDDTPDAIPEVILGDPLEPEVERHEEVLAGPRLRAPLLGDLPPVRVHDDPPLAVDAREQRLVGRLDPLLADPVAHRVAARSRPDLVRRGLGEIAERVRGHDAVRVEPPLRDRDGELRMLRRARLDRGDLLDAEVLGDRGRHELRVSKAPLDARPHLIGRELQHGDGEVLGVREVLRLAPVELEVVGGLVLDEGDPVAVEDVAARRRDLDRAEPVVLREREVVVAPHDLDVPVGDREDGEDAPHQDPRELDAAGELTPVLADSQHRRDTALPLTAVSSTAASPTNPATRTAPRPRAPRP